MATFEFNNKTIYIDGRLKAQLDKKIIPDLQRKDKDVVFIVEGRERCQPEGNTVLMADGSWKDIKDIATDDLVISPQIDGTIVFARVTKTMQYTNSKIFEVSELNRNKKLLYTCSSNHLIPINVLVSPRERLTDEERLLTKQERFEIFTKKKRFKGHWVVKNYPAEYYPNLAKHTKINTTTLLCPPIDKFYGRENCLIEPYTLGVWLGDGHWAECIGITSNSPEVIKEVEKTYPILSISPKHGTLAKTYFFSVKCGLRNQLAHYGLKKANSGTKFIPKSALLSDLDYRKRLLAGLIDTDGYYSKGGGYSITTKSERLACDILSLVRSLGGIGNINIVHKGIKKINFVGKYYNVSFRVLDVPIIKQYKIREGKRWYLSTNRCSIDVKPTDRFETVYGFEIDSNSSLYITNNYVVTHNSGKSKFGDILAAYVSSQLKSEYNLSCIGMTPEEFRNKIITAKPKSVVIYDEAHRGMASSRTLSEINNILKDLMMEMGQKNLFVIIILPTFFMLDKYAALFRSKGVFHIYERRGQRGYWVYFNEKNKLKLYRLGKKEFDYNCIKWPRFRGRFYNQYAINEEEYREKKRKSFADKPRITKAEVYKAQRDTLFWIIINKLDVNYPKITRLCKESYYNIGRKTIYDAVTSVNDEIVKKINEEEEDKDSEIE